MEEVIKVQEEAIAAAQWDVNWHFEKLQKAQAKLDYLNQGLIIIKAAKEQQEAEELPI